MSQLEELTVFVRVAEAGGIGKAAEQLGLAKSAVSRRLSELEKRLGVKLINRTTRRFSMTDNGMRCYQHALRVQDVVAELNFAVAEQQEQEISGILRLSAPLSFGMDHMGPVIDAFMRQYPRIQLDMELTDRFVDLVESGQDLAIRIGMLKDSTYQARKLTDITTALVASPAYLAQHGRPQTPKELAAHTLLVYDRSKGPTVELTDSQGQSHTVTLRSHATVNNGSFLNQLAVQGHGILLSPRFISGAAIKRGELEVVLPGYTTFNRQAYAVYPQTRFLARHVRVFIDFVAEYFADSADWEGS